MRDRTRGRSSSSSARPGGRGPKTSLSTRVRATLNLQRAVGNQAVSGMILQLAKKDGKKDGKPETPYTLTMAPLGDFPVVAFHFENPRTDPTHSKKPPPPPVSLTLASTPNWHELFKAAVDTRGFEQAHISGTGLSCTLISVSITFVRVGKGPDGPTYEVTLNAEKIEFA